MAARKIVQRGDKFDDTGVKNRWRWEWLEYKMNGENLRRYVRKLEPPGMAFCALCQKELNYSSRGRTALEVHFTTAKHREAETSLQANATIAGK